MKADVLLDWRIRYWFVCFLCRWIVCQFFTSWLAITPFLDSPLKRKVGKKKENERKGKAKKMNPTSLVTCSQDSHFELISTHHLFVEILSIFILWKDQKEGMKKSYKLKKFPSLS